jgi:dihydroorotase
MNQITIRKPNDFHHHLRDGNILPFTTEYCFSNFKNVIVMPNLLPPVTTIKEANDYKDRITQNNIYNGNPMMTLYFNKDLQEIELRSIKDNPFIYGIKYYPKNATTNSKYGIENIESVFHILKIMEEENIPLLIHGESIQFNVDIFDKEKVFIENELTKIINNFPKLRIVLEHISTKESVDFVLKHNIHATITPHHLLLDRNDIFRNGINPHLYCLPILKRNNDKLALVEAAISGKSNFFLGTDNAPHTESNKLTSCGCAGIFNSPVAVELVTQIFSEYNALHNLEKFMSTNGCDFYNLPYNDEYITLTNEEWVVPLKYGEIVPLYSGKTIKWKQNI